MNNQLRKSLNDTLKLQGEELSKAMWEYHKTLERQHRPKIMRYLSNPTISSLSAWYKFWEPKIEMSDIHKEYFEFVLDKIEKS